MWLVNIITAKTNIWSQMTSRRVDFVIQSRSNQKATSWKGFTLDKCTCMVKELHLAFKINNTTNICAFKLNVKVISTEQCSLFIRFMHVCMCMCVFVCQTHRLAAGNPVWRVHGVCKTLTALEKTRLFRRDWEHRPMLGIIVACSCRPPRPSLHRSWELTVCRRVRVREQRRDVFRPAAPVHRSDSGKWQWTGSFLLACRRVVWLLFLLLPRTLIRQQCSHSPAGGLLGCREQRSLPSFTLITLKSC